MAKIAKANSNAKGQHGGVRKGAGRKPNSHVTTWQWLQIGAMLTPEEHARIKNPNLTPAQRCYRLLYSRDDGTTAQVNEPNNDALVFACVRIAYYDASARASIQALSMPERRVRLLTIPPGGDLVDDRPGRWDNN